MSKDEEITALRAELRSQWESSHAEHCGSKWPHPEGKPCYWPVPAILEADREIPWNMVIGCNLHQNAGGKEMPSAPVDSGMYVAVSPGGFLEVGNGSADAQLHLAPGAIIRALADGGFTITAPRRGMTPLCTPFQGSEDR